MKVERWNFQKGEQVLFYVADTANSNLNISARVFTPVEGIKDFELRVLEEEIYYFTINFKVVGKYIIVFREDNIKKLIVIAAIKNG